MSDWSHCHRILAVRLDALGDLLMTTPALRALKESVPGRSVTLLTSPSGAVAAAHVSWIDEVIVYESPWMKHSGESRPEDDQAMIARLAAGGYDAAVIFTVYSQNPLPAAFLCHLAGIPRRLAHCRENPYQLLTDWVKEPEPAELVRHEVQRQLDLVRTVGAEAQDPRMTLVVPEAARWSIRAKLARHGITPGDGAPWVVVHPGATAASRRWAPAKFAAAADALATRHGWTVVWSGGLDEEPLVAGIQAAMRAPSVSLAGALGFPELAALLEAAPLLIANNTGPVHVAAAVGTPVVDLYALTNPQHTPWAVPSRVLNHDVPCKYCYKSVCPQGHNACLERVGPEAVVDAALELTCATGGARCTRSGSTPRSTTPPPASCATAPSSPPPRRSASLT